MKALTAVLALALAVPLAAAQTTDPVFDEDEVPWDEADPFAATEDEADEAFDEAEGSAGGDDEGASAAGDDGRADAPPPAPPKKAPGLEALLVFGLFGLAALLERKR